MKTNYTLCNYQCPVHKKCARYLSDMDKTKVVHFASMPYKKDKCGFFVELTEDDLDERVQGIINKINNNHNN